MTLLLQKLFAFSALFFLATCSPSQQKGALPEGQYTAFGKPQRVTIRGYDGDTMEPFISKDGHFLFFNNSNDPAANTNLYFAERVDDVTFVFKGEIAGVNTPALDAVASMDSQGNFYFVTTRSYGQTLSTIYRGHFVNGTVSDAEIAPGISPKRPGIVNFDAEISGDGNTLFFVDGDLTGWPLPKSADLVIAERDGASFRRSATSAEQLKNVNTKALEYAPAISQDLLELFFTRLNGTEPAIYRAVRNNAQEPFGIPEKVAAMSDFVEAPTLSGDGKSLYYHKREGSRFVIERVVR